MAAPIAPRGIAELMDYNRWASLKILELCEPLGAEELRRHMYTSHGSLFGTLEHTYMGDNVWLGRMKGDSSIRNFEPSLGTFAELRSVWTGVLEELVAITGSLDEAALERDIHFVSTTRGARSLPLWQVFLHLVNHGSYHRGQAAALLRQLGHNVVSTDESFYWLDGVGSLAKPAGQV